METHFTARETNTLLAIGAAVLAAVVFVVLAVGASNDIQGAAEGTTAPSAHSAERDPAMGEHLNRRGPHVREDKGSNVHAHPALRGQRAHRANA